MLSIDIETYSEIELKDTGVYPYAEHDSFEVLLFAYAFGDGPVNVIDMANGDDIPDEVMEAMGDKSVLKTAFNANFERTCLAQLRPDWSDPAMWSCSSVRARYNGLPGSLADAAKALGIDEQKDAAGKRLIQFFSKPCKPTKANGGRTRNRPEDDPEKWAQFIEYCRQDVEVERAVRRATKELPPSEQELWIIDQIINDTGVEIDAELVAAAIEADTAHQKALVDECRLISGIDNPGSVAQLKTYLEAAGMEVDGLRKDTLPDLIEVAPDDTTRRVIEIRQELSRTSTKKYDTMRKAVCRDGRVRGLFQFYGASRTGRWAGRLVQVQNLPRNYIKDLAGVRGMVKAGHADMIEALYGSLPDTLSQLIRTAIVPPPGKKFIVSDFSAIEARVIAWMAGEDWRLDVFKKHGKIYEASASAMFGVPMEQIHKGHPLRQKGKIAELALGYGGSNGALITMGALNMGLTESELPELVAKWREANPAIVDYWHRVERRMIETLETGDRKNIIPKVYDPDYAEHRREIGLPAAACGALLRGAAPELWAIPRKKELAVKLPSGRELFYAKARLEVDERFNKPCVTYLDNSGRTNTYGGKLVENIVQAVARDCLAEGIKRVHSAGHKIVMHIHDEVVIEADTDTTVGEINDLMSQPIAWAPGLPMDADGFECDFYQKD